MFHKIARLAILATVLMLVACEPTPVPTPTQTPGPEPPVDRLPFGTQITPDLVVWFNGVGQPNDVATITAMGPDGIVVGRRQAVFASAVAAEGLVPDLVGRIDMIGYDLEHWDKTPDDEQDDPLSAVWRLRMLADQHGMKLTLGPDRRFTESHGPQMAPYADRYVLQCQRGQDDTGALLEYVVPMAALLRVANPGIEVWISLRLADDNVDQLLAIVDLLESSIDGVAILNTSSGTGALQAFVDGLAAREYK